MERERNRKALLDAHVQKRRHLENFSTRRTAENRRSDRQTHRHGREHLSAPRPFQLSTLKRTHRLLTVDDLKIGQKHLGAYLLCRNIAPPLSSQGTHLIAEDVGGTAVQVSLYNFLSPCLTAGCVSWAMSVGDVFIIVEPYFKIAKDGVKTVRCDNLAHLVLLDDEDPFLTDVDWATGLCCPEKAMVIETSRSSVQAMAEEGKRLFKAK